MRRGDITSGRERKPDNRTRVLVAVEPRAYRSAIGSVIQALRPHLEVTVVEPDELHAEVARLEPALVISSQPRPATSDGGPAWVELRLYEEASARVCIGGRCARLYDPNLYDLLSVVDEAERLSRTPPEGPLDLCLASYGMEVRTVYADLASSYVVDESAVF
jgi:hypothetical protein